MAQMLKDLYSFCGTSPNVGCAVFLLACVALVGATAVGMAMFAALGRFGRRR